MNVLGVIILLGFGTVEVLSRGPGEHQLSTLCYSCHHVDDPSHCHTIEKCWGGGQCGTDVKTTNGVLEFSLGCYEAKQCDHEIAVIGKRERHHDQQHVCRKCCDGATCNKYLCSEAAVNHKINATAAPVIGHVTDKPGACVDHDKDGFSCNLFNISMCTETEPSKYSYILAHSKCARTCGFCTDQGSAVTPLPTDQVIVITAGTLQPDTAAPTIVIDTAGTIQPDTAAPTAASACVDDPSYDCAGFDQLNFCTDKTSFAWQVAQEKCRKHCNLCTDAVSATTAHVDWSSAAVATGGPIVTVTGAATA